MPLGLATLPHAHSYIPTCLRIGFDVTDWLADTSTYNLQVKEKIE